MGLPIERWAKDAVDLEYAGSVEPVASPRVWDDIEDARALGFQTWRQRQRAINESGVPTALEGIYAGLNAFPLPAASSVTSINGTVALWTTSLWTPIPANSLLAPSAFRVLMTANITTVASPANIGFDPRIGAPSTTGGAIAGSTLGASTNVALTASITAAFYYVVGDVTVRTIQAPGANSTAFGMFHYVGTQATSGGLAGPAVVGAGHNLLFGHTSASFDASVAGGFSLGAVHTVTSITHVVQTIHFSSWN